MRPGFILGDCDCLAIPHLSRLATIIILVLLLRLLQSRGVTDGYGASGTKSTIRANQQPRLACH